MCVKGPDNTTKTQASEQPDTSHAKPNQRMSVFDGPKVKGGKGKFSAAPCSGTAEVPKKHTWRLWCLLSVPRNSSRFFGLCEFFIGNLLLRSGVEVVEVQVTLDCAAKSVL